MRHETYDLKQMQSLPLEAKIIMSKQRIRQWYDHWDSEVYVSFSGGKDSTVLKHLVETTDGVRDVESVFVNTGLEYPEVRMFAMSQPNVTVVRPKMRFDEVIEKYGYPVISKEVAGQIDEIRNTKSEYLRNKRLFGDDNGNGKLPKKWEYLIDAPFKISKRCCQVMKKSPIYSYETKTKKKPYVGTMTDESNMRYLSWVKHGCNAFDMKKPQSRPLSFWTEQDVLEYLVKYELPYSSVYGEIKRDENGKYYTTGCDRTGCMFCMFGCHLDKEPNRFQRMKDTHPRQYDYCMNQLGLKKVLDYIGVDTE